MALTRVRATAREVRAGGVACGEVAAGLLEGEVGFEQAQTVAADQGLGSVEVLLREGEVVAQAVEGGAGEQTARDVVGASGRAQAVHGRLQVKSRELGA